MVQKSDGINWCRHDGFYDIRVTAELWRSTTTTILRSRPLTTPRDEFFVDERFVIPPAKLVSPRLPHPHKIARALDDNGQDVTDIVTTLDGKAVNTFGRGQFQGLTRDHYLEVDLGDDAPKSGRFT